jgi:hypothetical protein
VETWQRSELTDVTAKVVIYEAFVEGRLEAPKHLARTLHDLYFEPKYEEFPSRTVWSLSNAFTSAFKHSNQFRNSRRQQNWVNSWKPGSPNRSRLSGGAAVRRFWDRSHMTSRTQKAKSREWQHPWPRVPLPRSSRS